VKKLAPGIHQLLAPGRHEFPSYPFPLTLLEEIPPIGDEVVPISVPVEVGEYQKTHPSVAWVTELFLNPALYLKH
jgi:hypothetical protein